jgi:hypothetical protein
VTDCQDRCAVEHRRPILPRLRPRPGGRGRASVLTPRLVTCQENGTRGNRARTLPVRLDARSAVFGAIIKRAFGIGLAAELHMRVICMTLRHVRRGVALLLVLALWLTAAPASAQNRADRPGSDTGTTAVARPSSPTPAPAPTPAPGRAAATPADRGERSGSSGGGTTPAGGDNGSDRRRRTHA